MSKEGKERGILLDSGTNEVEFLLITLGKQRYGVNVSKVCTIQVYDASKVSLMPHQKQEVLGVMPFREKTISIIDLSKSLNWDVSLAPENPRLLIVAEFNKRTTGFVVDGVDRIERFSWEEFEPISETTCNASQASILGTVKTPSGLILILDLETIMAELDPSMSVEHYAPEIATATIPRTGVKIMHCDDSNLIQTVVARVLAGAGFANIKQFNNGLDALNYLKEHGSSSIDIILSDIEMPKMDGLSFCKLLKQEQNLSKIPVVFFSSLISEQMLAKCKAVGGTNAFSKPQINMLVSEIDALIANSLRKN